MPLRDIETIASTLLECSETTKDPVLLAADVRYALRRSIVSMIAGDRRELTVFVLENALENTLLNALAIAQQAGQVSLDNIPVEPSLLNQLQKRGCTLIVCGLNSQPGSLLYRSGFIDHLGDENVCTTLTDALARAEYLLPPLQEDEV